MLDSWTRQKQYDSLCHVLGSGLNIHLTENELLRDIFELGDRLILNELTVNKQSKLERVSTNLFLRRTSFLYCIADVKI